MTHALLCRPIHNGELEAFSRLIASVAGALAAQGQGLWQPEQLTASRLERDYGHDNLFFGLIGAEPVATFVLIEHDPSFWPDVPPGESLFLHKVAVARAWKGHGFAGQILDFSLLEARARGKAFLRLDTDSSRPVLCRLYEDYGFRRVGRKVTATMEYALYELAV